MTGMESPQSISITGYYKGFSVIVTKRDAQAKVKPLIDDAIKAIDHMIETGFVPSWNLETNRQALGKAEIKVEATPEVTKPPTTQATKPCPLHQGKNLYYKTGKFGGFWSHTTGEVNGNGKPIYCNGYDKTKPMSVEQYENHNMPTDDF